jgi:hypothetical protein
LNRNLITPVTLWYISNSNDTAAVSLILVGNSMLLAYGNHVVKIPFSISMIGSRLNYFLFYENSSSLSININGFNTTIFSTFFINHHIFNNSIMNIGFPSGAGSNEYNYVGNVSLIYYSNVRFNYITDKYLILKNNININLTKTISYTNSIHIDILSSLKKTRLILENHIYTFNSKITNLTVGKLTSGEWGLIIRVNSISLSADLSNGYYLIPIFYFTFFPYILIGIIIYYMKAITKHP